MYTPRSNKPDDTRAHGYRPPRDFPWGIVLAVIASYCAAVAIATFVGMHLIDAYFTHVARLGT